MPLDYRAAYTRRLAENVADVVDAAAAHTLDDAHLEKIGRFADKHGYTVDAICAALEEPGPAARMLAATFAKDPVKQGLHETLAAGYIEAMRRHGSQWITGYGSAIAALAQFALELGL